MSDQQRQVVEHRVFRRTELFTEVEIEVEDLSDGAAAARTAAG